MTGEDAVDLMTLGALAALYLAACVWQLLCARCVLAQCGRCSVAVRRSAQLRGGAS